MKRMDWLEELVANQQTFTVRSGKKCFSNKKNINHVTEYFLGQKRLVLSKELKFVTTVDGIINYILFDDLLYKSSSLASYN